MKVSGEFRRISVAKQMVEGVAELFGANRFASDCQLENESSRLFHEAIRFHEVERTLHFVMNIPKECPTNRIVTFTGDLFEFSERHSNPPDLPVDR